MHRETPESTEEKEVAYRTEGLAISDEFMQKALIENQIFLDMEIEDFTKESNEA